MQCQGVEGLPLHSPPNMCPLSSKAGAVKSKACITHQPLSSRTCQHGYLLLPFTEAWRADLLQKLYHMAGVDGKPVVFLLTDSQISNESFLEDMNSLLNSGNVPGMYASEDKDRIIGSIREWLLTQGAPTTKVQQTPLTIPVHTPYTSWLHRKDMLLLVQRVCTLAMLAHSQASMLHCSLDLQCAC